MRHWNSHQETKLHFLYVIYTVQKPVIVLLQVRLFL